MALVPGLVARLTGAGFEVAVEPGAGAAAHHADDDYRAAGATVTQDAAKGAGVLLGVQPPTDSPGRRARRRTRW